MGRILVTGATGFVGRNIVEAARAARHEVVAVGGPNSATSVPSVDVGDLASVHKLADLGNFDAMIHSAGIAHRSSGVTPDEYRRINAAGCQNVARLAAQTGAQRLVLVSSVLVYGRKDREPGHCVGESDECRPDDAYAASKLAGERLAAEICADAPVELTVLRPAPILGENGRGNFDRLMRAIDGGRFLRVGSGANMRSLVYVGDVAQVAVECVDKGISGIFNLAAEPVSMKELVDRIASALGKKLPPLTVPNAVANAAATLFKATPATLGLSKTLENWLATDLYCTDKAAAAGIAPTTTVQDAVERAVLAYRATK